MLMLENSSGKRRRDAIERLAAPRLLVINEIKERTRSLKSDRLLTHLVDHRYGASRDTLIVSNQLETTLLEALGASIASRLHESGIVIPCTWPSFRAAGADHEKLQFQSSQAASA